MPSRLTSVYTSAAAAASAAIAAKSAAVSVLSSTQASDCNLPVASVHANCYLAWEVSHGCTHEGRVAHGDGAKHRAGSSGTQHIADRLQRSDSAADLYGNRAGEANDLAHELGVHGSGAACGVQVHDVNPVSSGIQEVASCFTRILVVNRFAGEVALDEVHALAAANVDGRVDVHPSVKLRSRCLASQADEVCVDP